MQWLRKIFSVKGEKYGEEENMRNFFMKRDYSKFNGERGFMGAGFFITHSLSKGKNNG